MAQEGDVVLITGRMTFHISYCFFAFFLPSASVWKMRSWRLCKSKKKTKEATWRGLRFGLVREMETCFTELVFWHWYSKNNREFGFREFFPPPHLSIFRDCKISRTHSFWFSCRKLFFLLLFSLQLVCLKVFFVFVLGLMFHLSCKYWMTPETFRCLREISHQYLWGTKWNSFVFAYLLIDF